MGTEKGEATLRQTLDYIYTLLNVKKDNELNEIEESVLNGFILTSFKNYTFEEIKHAYRLAAAGALNVELFQKLDAVSFGKVLKAYKTHKENKIKNHTQKRKELPQFTEQQKAEAMTEFMQLINEYKKERPQMEAPEISVLNSHIFKELYVRKEITIDKTEKKHYIEKAEKLWPKEKHNRKNEKNKIWNLDNLGRDQWILQAASCLALFDKTKTP